MTLARTTLFVICTNDLGRAGRNYRQPPRPNAASTFDIRRSRRLAAKWHVCPQTHRLDAMVVRGGAPYDQLCRHTMQRRRRRTSRRRLIRPLGHNDP